MACLSPFFLGLGYVGDRGHSESRTEAARCWEWRPERPAEGVLGVRAAEDKVHTRDKTPLREGGQALYSNPGAAAGLQTYSGLFSLFMLNESHFSILPNWLGDQPLLPFIFSTGK